MWQLSFVALSLEGGLEWLATVQIHWGFAKVNMKIVPGAWSLMWRYREPTHSGIPSLCKRLVPVRVLNMLMSEYRVDQSTATPTWTWSKTIRLTYNQHGEPNRSKVKCQLIDPSIISLHTVSVLAMAPAVEAICGKWGDPTPNIRVVHAERKYSSGLSSLYFSGFVVSLGVAFCFILMKYHHASWDLCCRRKLARIASI